MSEAIATPSPASALRRIVARVWNDPDMRSTAIGLLGVLIVHLLLLLFAPHMLRLEHAPSVMRPYSSSRHFNIELAPETFIKAPPKAPLPQQFVETNPDAPENIPDRTNNFGAQNQQVAQEKPTPKGKSESPAMEGRTDIKSTALVSGDRSRTAEQPAPVTIAEPPTPMTPTVAPRAEQNPLPGTQKMEGDAPDGIGTNVAEAARNPTAVPEKVEGLPDVPLVQGATSDMPQIDRNRPRQRPTLSSAKSSSRPAIFQQRTEGTSNIGIRAHNALQTTYGVYLNRLKEAVAQRWDDILDSSRIDVPRPSRVAVAFKLNKEGKISAVVSVEGDSSEFGRRACVSAINPRLDFSYGEWTSDMIAILGDETEIEFTFYYL